MRGGPLADKRNIRLINRRFVPFFFNVGRNAPGYDADAHKLIMSVDKRFGGRAVPTPPVWVFTPDLKHVGTISNYATKDQYFSQLLKLLDENEKQNAMSSDDKKEMKKDAGRVWEDLGQYDKAAKEYGKKKDYSGLARVARYRKNWDEAAKHIKKIKAKDDAAMESAHRMIAEKEYKEARDTLVKAIKENRKSNRLGEMHYWAGVACFFLNERDWANFHWCYVMRNLPDDYKYMACYFAASAEAMPYRNPDLGGYRSRGGFVTHSKADKCRAEAMEDYERLKKKF